MVYSSSAQQLILSELKQRFEGNATFEKYFQNILLICTDIPAVHDETTKNRFRAKILELKDFLILKCFDKKKIAFLDEQLKIYEGVQFVEEYYGQQIEVDEVIKKALSFKTRGSEGVVKIPFAYNWKQLNTLTNYIYNDYDPISKRKQKRLCFFISQESTLRGQIIAKVFETPQEIEVLKEYLSLKEDRESGERDIKICMFGEYASSKQYQEIRSVSKKYYVYRFISEFNEEFFVLHDEDIATGEYTITGSCTKIRDNKRLTESIRISTKLPYFFIHTAKRRIVTYLSKEQFFKAIKKFKITFENMFDFPFIHRGHEKKSIYLNPEWYKWFLWSWMCHAPMGEDGFQKYPLHIMVLGETGTGKSAIMNSIHSNTCEMKDVFESGGSTIKSLIPSFKEKPAKMGYLAESNRFSFIDELFKLLLNMKQDPTSVNEVLASMNAILEHQKRTMGSGVSSIKIKMTARIMSASNFYKGSETYETLLKHISNSWLGRWLVYYQEEEHVNLIKDNIDKLPMYEHMEFYNRFEDKDFVGIIDYLQSTTSVFDEDRVMELYTSMYKFLSDKELMVYKARHKHHIFCIMDGLIKARCMMFKDDTFEATEIDYQRLTQIWRKIILSWKKNKAINYKTLQEKLDNIPAHAIILYDYIDTNKPSFNMLKEYALKQMNRNDFTVNMVILQERELIFLHATNGSYYTQHHIQSKLVTMEDVL